MMALLRRALLGATFASLMVLATASAKPMCAWFLHQPEVPQALRK
ncbi:MAG TPA: cyclic lactone autoinducer peptide [Spirochaetia bacterium]|nr:cyclic lactone autoinducer peptide [Spirochaetia bacterium]